MLYEMLTGTVPDSDNQISVAVKHLNTPIKPPMEINPKLSTALNDVILKATVKNPKFRYDSVADLRYDLERALREPTGEFARLNIPIEETQYKASKVNKGVKNVAIILSAVWHLHCAVYYCFSYIQCKAFIRAKPYRQVI